MIYIIPWDDKNVQHTTVGVVLDVFEHGMITLENDKYIWRDFSKDDQ